MLQDDESLIRQNPGSAKSSKGVAEEAAGGRRFRLEPYDDDWKLEAGEELNGGGHHGSEDSSLELPTSTTAKPLLPADLPNLPANGPHGPSIPPTLPPATPGSNSNNAAATSGLSPGEGWLVACGCLLGVGLLASATVWAIKNGGSVALWCRGGLRRICQSGRGEQDQHSEVTIEQVDLEAGFQLNIDAQRPQSKPASPVSPLSTASLVPGVGIQVAEEFEGSVGTRLEVGSVNGMEEEDVEIEAGNSSEEEVQEDNDERYFSCLSLPPLMAPSPPSSVSPIEGCSSGSEAQTPLQLEASPRPAITYVTDETLLRPLASRMARHGKNSFKK